MQIDSKFPGGNIVVESVTADDVRLHQELRDTGFDWFYWCFRVRGTAGRSVRFTFTKSRAMGVRGPAMSIDGGLTWTWLGREIVDGNSVCCTFPANVPEVMLSFAMPYQESHWRRFMAEEGKHPAVVQDTLCITPKGRTVEYVIIRCETSPVHRIAITCRHHCCEMMANYALEGMIRWLLHDSEARWLRKKAEFLIVPFVDKDGVEDGDQGKGRQPRDHGRDYEGESIYAATKAIRQMIPRWGAGCLHIGLDLHCPHISGPHNEVIYLVGSAHDRIAREQKRFSEVLESVADGPLPFSASDFLPFGEAWNTGKNYSGGKGFSRWIAETDNIMLGTGIEIPYANAGGAEVNAASARCFGADLGRALAGYLRSSDGINTTSQDA